MTVFPLNSGAHFKSALAAFPKIYAVRSSRHGGEYRPFFVVNPTTGALEVPIEHRDKALKALQREVRRIKHGLYLLKARLYFEFFGLQAIRTVSQGRRISSRPFQDLAGNRHRQPR
jgi:hypothetical protein